MLEGKSALVTGGGSGIGRAVSIGYAHAGARVVVADISVVDAEATAVQIRRAGGEAIAVHVDVSLPSDHVKLADLVCDRFGRLDVVCNNAGIAGDGELLAGSTILAWDRVIAVNLSGIYFALRAQIPAMIPCGGAIINISSVLGQVGAARASAYVAAKHGVVGLTRAAALDYADQGIRINSIAPGFIETAILTDQMDRSRMIARHPIGRLGTPAEVAELAIWLSSDNASFATGGVYPVDGGYLAS